MYCASPAAARDGDLDFLRMPAAGMVLGGFLVADLSRSERIVGIGFGIAPIAPSGAVGSLRRVSDRAVARKTLVFDPAAGLRDAIASGSASVGRRHGRARKGVSQVSARSST